VHRPDAELTFDRGRFTGLDLDLREHGTWTWRAPATGGRLPLPGPAETTPQWSEGTVTRSGEDRRVAFSHTWAETYPSHLSD
jgi:hypothetical protein